MLETKLFLKVIKLDLKEGAAPFAALLDGMRDAELQQLDEDTVNIQRRNIKSTDHKKKRFDIAFYINLWHQKLSDFATAEAQRAAGGEAWSRAGHLGHAHGALPVPGA